MADLAVRRWRDDDRDFLWEMLYEAACWRSPGRRPPREEALQSPQTRRYLQSWGREDDRAVIATVDGERVGAGWYRLFSDEEPGYGFVDATTPELSLAVVPTSRRRGIGRLLLAAVLAQAQLDHHLAISLSVEQDNPARSLYEQLGFEAVERGGDALTMINRFALR